METSYTIFSQYAQTTLRLWKQQSLKKKKIYSQLKHNMWISYGSAFYYPQSRETVWRVCTRYSEMKELLWLPPENIKFFVVLAALSGLDPANY